MASSSKQTRGKQKIEMKRIDDDDDRMITFSKRRSGIYKKASELVTMCGTEVGIVVFSPTGKPYSFGHPSVQAVLNKFLNRNVPPPADDRLQPLIDANIRMRRERYNDFFNQLLARLDNAKERGKDLSRITHATSEGNSSNWERGWWEKPLQELSFDELKEEALFLEALHRDICNYLNYPSDLNALGVVDPALDPRAVNDPPTGVEGGAGPSGEDV
ncbi:agamous-like MADS-box protein AGL61 [Punica granatum]|uniref:MADS-box domain-containing protein n=2 Tax=Punica granatum TaxID=22663 RepID=A0A218WXU5_PUNGR|nr:agamous-like MADS-box protein AGL61 [Punica granatum]OWM77524.1 hypothetical protein CDL15_Pgr016922 [Punica granatum]PKI74735.1 hypothetical protein CRG98_004844 [Punica granatum]